jgi:hypothetical protein
MQIRKRMINKIKSRILRSSETRSATVTGR